MQEGLESDSFYYFAKIYLFFLFCLVILFSSRDIGHGSWNFVIDWFCHFIILCIIYKLQGAKRITGQYSLLRTSAPQEVLVRTGQHWSVYTREASEIFKLSGCWQFTYHTKEDVNTFPMTPGSLTPWGLSNFYQKCDLFCFTKLLTVWHKCTSKASLLRCIRVLEENTIWNLDRLAIQLSSMDSSFFPKTISAWNGLAFVEALSLAGFR